MTDISVDAGSWRLSVVSIRSIRDASFGRQGRGGVPSHRRCGLRVKRGA